MKAMAAPRDLDPEEPVIEAIRGGDRYAFEELVRRQNRWVRGVVFGVLGRPDEVDDVLQQVWLSVWQRIPKLREPGRWRSWLYRLARNAAIDAGRNTTRARSRSQPLPVEAQSRLEGRPTDRDSGGDEGHAEVLDAIKALPALYREPFVLRHLHGWSYQQIGEVMGMPVDSIETRLVRARRFLRESLHAKRS
jgi:RNA polymerase sigma-70 factor (ECF subfamily)